MTAQQSALVVVLPDDDAETVQAKILAGNARSVQLLVPDGVAALRDPITARKLAATADQAGIDLLLISSDPPTLRAARMGGLQLLRVDVAPVRAPGSQPGAIGATTQILRREQDTQSLEAELTAGDAAFLDALDDLDAPPLREPGRFDPESAAVNDMLARYRTPPPHMPPTPTSSADADLAAALDSLDDLPPPRPAPRRPQTASLPPPRVSEPVRSAPVAPEHRQPTPRVREQPLDVEPETQPARRNWLLPILSLVLLLLLLAIGAVLVMSGLGAPSVAIAVSPPTLAESIEPVNALPIPIVPPGDTPVNTAVAAAPITLELVDVTIAGTVPDSTQEPAGFAGGTVQVLSLNNQPINLPAGTEFVAVKPDGQEVAFLSTTDVTVPPATTSDQGAQIVTSLGQVSVTVSARSPGSASNVDANTIRRMTIPGGGTFGVESGALRVNHDPLGGGSESEAFVVKETDVRRALGEALAQLDAEGRRRLAEQAATSGLQVETSTISPQRSDLEQLSGFEYQVTPPVGSRLDPGTTQFSLRVTARYAALATPVDRPLSGPALQDAFSEQVRQAGLLTPGDCRAPTITGWEWDGATLFVNGTIGPDPRCGNGLDDNARRQIYEAVRGKSRAEAAAALDALQAAGVIGGYTLPEVDIFPERDQQIELVIQ